MILHSTRGAAPSTDFRGALFQGQAPDGGLYMPDSLPVVDLERFRRLARFSYKDLAAALVEVLLGDELGEADRISIVEQAYSFEPVLRPVGGPFYALELFHGPTLSFKDFGAQFMAKCMGHFIKEGGEEITILVATSGDTGSAVAHAYHKVDGIRIVLLYPSGKVSPLQEKQFTTLGDNVDALEIQGTFDDCQALVKRAFADGELSRKRRLSSANSINIGRLVPQSFYYFFGVLNLDVRPEDVVICVPSGNFGNLTAGLFAGEMGLNPRQYLVAVNRNKVIPEYLKSGEYRPRPSIRTLSNAMDVGDPSNWERIRHLFGDDADRIRARLYSDSVEDTTTLQRMWREYEGSGYVIDPHTAVGFEVAQRYYAGGAVPVNSPCIILSTAHPGKFKETVVEALGFDYELPEALKALQHRGKMSTPLSSRYQDFKDYLWHTL